jgi:hypothetical protein
LSRCGARSFWSPRLSTKLIAKKDKENPRSPGTLGAYCVTLSVCFDCRRTLWSQGLAKTSSESEIWSTEICERVSASCLVITAFVCSQSTQTRSHSRLRESLAILGFPCLSLRWALLKVAGFKSFLPHILTSSFLRTQGF